MATRAYPGGMIRSDGFEFADLYSVSKVHINPAAILPYIRVADPSRAQIPKEGLKLYITNGGLADFPDGCFCFNENGILDIVVAMTMPPNMRERHVEFHVVDLDMNSEEARQTYEHSLIKLTIVAICYLLHGSLGNLVGDNPTVVKFATDAFEMDARELSLSRLSTMKRPESLKLVGFIENIHGILEESPATLRSRFLKGMGGQRILAVGKAIKGEKPDIQTDNKILRLVLSDEVHKNMPYLTLHPDHPNCPTKDVGKNVMRALGEIAGKAGIDLKVLYRREPGLFIKPVKDLLEEGVNMRSANFGSEAEWSFALQPAFSVKLIMSQLLPPPDERP